MNIEVNGLTLNYDEFGTGDTPLVLLHGFTQSRSDWQGVIGCLPLDRLHVYAFDAHGHGRSDAPPSGYVASNAARDIAEAMRLLGFEAFHFAAHSMGGFIGLALAAHHPASLLSLTLVSPAPAIGVRNFDPERQLLAAAREAIGDTDRYWSWIATWAARQIEPKLLAELKRRHEDPGEATLEAGYDLMAEDLSGILSRIVAPALMVTGERDPLREANLADAARIPGCGLHLFYRAGHMLEMEVPAELARLIVDFIENGARRAEPAQASR
jgi:pimeloyl-ACP methyl ester carboxylesterase